MKTADVVSIVDATLSGTFIDDELVDTKRNELRDKWITAALRYSFKSKTHAVPTDVHAWLEGVLINRYALSYAVLAFIGSVIVECQDNAQAFNTRPVYTKRNNVRFYTDRSGRNRVQVVNKKARPFIPFASSYDTMHTDGFDNAPVDHNVTWTFDENGNRVALSQAYCGGAEPVTRNARKVAPFTPTPNTSEHTSPVTMMRHHFIGRTVSQVTTAHA